MAGYRNNKYNARKIRFDGHVFDSSKEATRYLILKDLERHGQIEDLVLQPAFVLQKKFQYEGKTLSAIKYIADFMYKNHEGNLVVEDVKGYKTDVYNLKKKLFLRLYKRKYIFQEI